MSSIIPMFPLGSVLFPQQLLALHIFEHRYRSLVRTCLEQPSDFGVTLIAQGHEVGGGDARTAVGALAHVEEAVEFDDGRWALVARGITRIRVLRWLDDDPYPIAEVEEWPDGPAFELDLDRCIEIERLRADTARMAESLGYRAVQTSFDPTLSPVDQSLRLCATSPLGEADRFDLLCAPDPGSRLELLERRLLDQQVVLGSELAMGHEPRDW